MSFEIGDLVRVISTEEIKQQGFSLSPLGRRCINKIGIVQEKGLSSLSIKQLRISFIEKEDLISAIWAQSLIKKIISSKNNLFKI